MNYKSSIIELWKAADKEFSIKAEGTSMFPFFRPGDNLTIKSGTPNNIRIGDIAAFLQDKNIIVHRIVKKKKAGGQIIYCQKGDNVQGWGWITQENIIGRVESVRRGDKTVNILKGRPFRSGRIKGLAGWCLVTAFETIYSIAAISGWHPTKNLSFIQANIIQVINKIK
ncbi:MAG: signal peptidase I [Desulfobacteraceae bacterium]|nr:signal peptidase I [Desulfobacteraceae bacterium]